MTSATFSQALNAVTLEDVQAEYARRHLRAFVEQAWPIVEARTFVSNWHLDVLCDHLEAVTKGDCAHLLINIPPGTAKSLIVSVFWPAWMWATDPSKRFIAASYGQDLATRDAVKMRVLIESPWYQQHWPMVFRGDANQKTRYENEDGGWRLATSVGGRGTGEHPDFFIIADPHNVTQAESELERQQARDWCTQTVSTRGVSRGVAIVVIMQRLHELDLSGLILSGASAGKWTHLCLPMRAESERALVPTKAHRPTVDPRQPGDLLWPSLFTEEMVQAIEIDLGSYAAAGQLQQRPAPAEGGILKLKWLKYYAPDTLPTLDNLVISVDPAMKDKQQHDFWSIQAWGVKGPNRYALRRIHARLGLGEAVQHIADLHRWAVATFPGCGVLVLIENAAAGPDAIRVLRRQITGVVPWTARGDKQQRAMAASPVLEAGNVIVPGAEDIVGGKPDPGLTPGWVQEMVTEWASFPNGAHDDDVDAFSQMVLRTQQTGHVGMARVEQFL
jgi:predicted phage terminase large subunit-like protein